MIVVSDTTAITSLLQIDQCELLAKLYGEVVIPNAVRDELIVAHPSLPEFLRVRTIRHKPRYNVCVLTSIWAKPKQSFWQKNSRLTCFSLMKRKGAALQSAKV